VCIYKYSKNSVEISDIKEFYFLRSQVAEQQNKIARYYKNERTNKGLPEEKEPASTPQGSLFFCDKAACCVLVLGQTRTTDQRPLRYSLVRFGSRG
jgi:hypothetical protein